MPGRTCAPLAEPPPQGHYHVMADDTNQRSPFPISEGGPRVRTVPEGDSLERLMCPDCGFVDYENPKIVVGAVAEWDGRILMCRRNIQPRRGYWTIPAGYLEINETVEDGARREAMEEANAALDLHTVLAIYNIPRISQVQIIFKASLPVPEFSPGPESQEVELFTWDQIPWSDLAFPSVHWALGHYREVASQPVFAPFSNPPGDTGDYTE